MDPVPRYDTTASSDSSDQKVTTANQCPSADPNVFIFGNALNMSVEKLGMALDERIGNRLILLAPHYLVWLPKWPPCGYQNGRRFGKHPSTNTGMSFF